MCYFAHSLQSSEAGLIGVQHLVGAVKLVDQTVYQPYAPYYAYTNGKKSGAKTPLFNVWFDRQPIYGLSGLLLLLSTRK